MAKPFFSIIIVVFNGDKTLGRAIDSVLDQQNENFELIIIDGGSTDKTLEIIEGYHEKVNYWMTEPDNGIYDAMNKGIAVANGEWLYFLGCDDYLHGPAVLGYVEDSIINSNSSFVYGNVSVNKKIYDGPFTFQKLLRDNIAHQAIFYKKQIFETLGTYNIRYTSHADWVFNIRCFSDPEINPIYVDIVVAVFSLGGASSSHDVLCLKEVVLPEKIKMLSNPKRLKNIKTYDEWWRLIRNARIRSSKEYKELLQNQPAPASIERMVRAQSLIPYKLLKVGPLSKLMMFKSYCINQIQTLR